MKKVILLSGGIDSTTCLALARKLDSPDDIVALNCFYGQRNSKEMRSARAIAEYYNVKIIEIDLADIFATSDCPMLARSSRQIEHKSYESQTEETKQSRPISSYVPFRNGIMLSAAVAIAYSLGAAEVWYGAHADDAEGNAYPDCSVEFINAMNSAVMAGTANAVRVVAPLAKMRKHEIVKIGIDLNAPYSLTWSCYEAGEHPCGKCGTCIAIKDAFRINGAEYPVK